MTSVLTEPLKRLLTSSVRVEPGYRRAQVVAVCARKGGVGKTTTAVNVAAGLALERGQRVLLVDMDAQGHCGSSLHAQLRGVASETMSDVLLGKGRDAQEAALKTAIEGLWVTPSDKDLGATEGVMETRIGKEFMLQRALKIARTHYDVIVIDCPPNLGTLTVNAMMAADWALIPCDMSILALEGVDDIYDMIDVLSDGLGRDLPILGILRTRVDLRNGRANQYMEDALRSRYARHLLETVIPVNTRLALAQLEGTPVSLYDRRCSGAVAYGALLDEIGPRLGVI